MCNMLAHKYPVKPTIALFIYDPKCSVQCGNGMIQALSPYYNFKLFSKNRVENVFFDDVDMVAVPGGIGDADTQVSTTTSDKLSHTRSIVFEQLFKGICVANATGHHNHVYVIEENIFHTIF